MAQLNPTNLEERRMPRAISAPAVPQPKSRWWLWLVVVVVVAALGIWYFRGSKGSIEAQGSAAPPAARRATGSAAGRDPAFATATHRQDCYAHRLLAPS